MNALFLRRRQRYELANWQPCENGCVAYGNAGVPGSNSHCGRKSATWEVELLDRHCAWLCDRCVAVWRLGWPAAGGAAPVVDGRRGASFGDREAA